MPDPDVCPRCATPIHAAHPCAACVIGVATARPQPPNLEGESFGSYILGRVLGQGGMGVVYEARDTRLGRTVALKMLADDFDEPDVLRREAEIVASIEHEHIVPIYEADEHEGIAYFTMRCIDGGPLETPAPTMRRAAEIALAIARAIEFAHGHNILHLDLKPANVLVDCSGKPFVTDFGLAIRDGLSTVDALSPGGTPLYMAPEVWRGDRGAASVAADVWGVGALLYEMLTGRPPFKASTKDELMKRVTTERPAELTGIPADLATICLRCLEKEPGDRYPNAASLAADLERYLAGEIVEPRPNARWWRRVKLILGALAFVVAALIGAFAHPVVADMRMRQSVKKTGDDFANSLANKMTKAFQKYAAVVEKGSREQDVIEALSNPRAVNPSDVCARLRLAPQSWPDSAWFLLDTHGKLVGRAPQIDDPDAERTYTYRDYYRGAEELEQKGERSAYISRAYRSALDKDYKIAFSITVHDKMDKRIGMLVATLPTGSRDMLGSVIVLGNRNNDIWFAAIAPRDPYRTDGEEDPAPVFLVEPALARGDEVPANMVDSGDLRGYSVETPIPHTHFSVRVHVTHDRSVNDIGYVPAALKL